MTNFFWRSNDDRFIDRFAQKRLTDGRLIANVLIVEDIIDSGYTLQYLKKYFSGKEAADVKVATLLDKPMARKVDITPDFTAFTLARPAFIIGYGLDLDQKYRNIDCILEVVE